MRWAAVFGRVCLLLLTLWAAACERQQGGAAVLERGVSAEAQAGAGRLGTLHGRLSEAGGYFDTDNLISNESGYLKVLDALRALGLRGGAYLGVGPDQNYSYLAALRPEIAFIVDIRRDNTLHHLLLKALIERAPTRIQFLAGLHGRPAPPEPSSWAERDLQEIVAWIDSTGANPQRVDALHAEVRESVTGYGIPLSEDDLATIRRFHQVFIDAGLGLRFTSLGRPPQPYYPTYRQLVLETDHAGRQASYLGSHEGYEAVRRMHLEDRIVPVVGDLAGDHALREIGAVLRERGLDVTAVYASNVEFYLWRARSFDSWLDNLAELRWASNGVVIRSYFPNAGPRHPSAIPGYHATQALQPIETLLRARAERPFSSYWEAVTRDAIDLTAGRAGG